MRSILIKYILLTLCVAYSNVLCAQSLLESYKLALENNVEFKNSVLARDIAKEKVKQVRSSLLPSVVGNARYTDSTLETSGSDQTINFFNGISETVDYTVSIDQVIYDRELLYDYKREAESYRLAQLNVELERQDLIIKVAQSYFEVLRGIESKISIESERDSIVQQLKQITSQYELGVIQKVDLLEAEAALDLVDTQLLEAESDIAVAIESYNVITGFSSDHIYKLAGELPVEQFLLSDIEQLIGQAKVESISAQSAESSLRQAEFNRKAKQSARLPVLKFNWSYQHSNADSVRGDLFQESIQDNTAYFINLEIPFYTGGRTSSVVRQAELEKRQQEQNKILVERNLIKDVRSELFLVKINRSKIFALQKSLESSKRTLESTQKGHELGVRTFNDVLQVQQNYHQKIRDVANSKYDYFESILKVKKVIGELSLSDVETINSYINISEKIYFR